MNCEDGDSCGDRQMAAVRKYAYKPHRMRAKQQITENKQPAGEEKRPICIICLNNIDDEEMGPASVVECGHIFHSSCISAQFLKYRIRSCPICRHKPSSLKPFSPVFLSYP